jgi:uncharacterized membrane protein YdjX (TVP38/TMEM64 family)
MHHFLEVLKAWGPLGVLVLAVVESAGIPNPGGTDLLLLFIAAARPQDAMLAGWLAVGGSVVGSMIFFELLRKGGERYLSRYTSSGRGQRFRQWFLRYGLITVFIPAFLPIPILPLKVFAASAAAMGIPRMRFLLVILLARVPRYLALGYLGSQLGENSGAWLKGHMWYLVALAAILTLGLGALARHANRES